MFVRNSNSKQKNLKIKVQYMYGNTNEMGVSVDTRCMTVTGKKLSKIKIKQ